jgi:hypothetical protein
MEFVCLFLLIRSHCCLHTSSISMHPGIWSSLNGKLQALFYPYMDPREPLLGNSSVEMHPLQRIQVTIEELEESFSVRSVSHHRRESGSLTIARQRFGKYVPAAKKNWRRYFTSLFSNNYKYTHRCSGHPMFMIYLKPNFVSHVLELSN